MKKIQIKSFITLISAMGVSSLAAIPFFVTSCGTSATYLEFSADLGTIATWNCENNEFSHVLPAADYTTAPYDNTDTNEQMLKHFSSNYTSQNFINAYMWEQNYIYEYSVGIGDIYSYFNCSINIQYKESMLTKLVLTNSRMYNDAQGEQHFVYERITTLLPVAITGLALEDTLDNPASYKLQMGIDEIMAFHIYYANNDEVLNQDTAQVLWSMNKWDVANIVLPE